MRGRIFEAAGTRRITDAEDLVEASSTQADLIFVSHQRDDLRDAEEVAECIVNCGLRAYLDDRDPAVDGDGPRLIDYLLGVIHRSPGLIVVASALTHASWWVPGEVFAAHDNGSLLGTYRLSSVSLRALPTYLRYRWPIMENHDGLHTWCRQFRSALPYRRRPAGGGRLRRSSLLTEEVAKVTGRDPGDFYGRFTDGHGGIRIFQE